MEIIRGVTLDIAAGERHAIIGPNGAGKSTLFNLISGRFGISSGSIRLEDEEISGLTPYEINRRGLSRSFQVTNIFPATVGLRKHALRGPVVARLQIFVLAWRRTCCRDVRERSRMTDGTDRPRLAPARCRRAC